MSPFCHSQQDEIEALKKRLSNANARMTKQEDALKEMENKVRCLFLQLRSSAVVLIMLKIVIPLILLRHRHVTIAIYYLSGIKPSRTDPRGIRRRENATGASQTHPRCGNLMVFPVSRINTAMLPAAAMDSIMMTYVFLCFAAGHVARAAGSDPGDLVPTVMPPNSTATIPQGFKAHVWSVMVRPPAFYPRLHAISVLRFVVAVFRSPSRCPPLPTSSPSQAMLHKEAIVCLPQSSAELPEEDGIEMLKPGEARAVGSLSPQEDPSDTALKLQAECLDGLDPADYAWVKVPIGSIIKWQGAPQSLGRHESFAIRHFGPSLTATPWCPPQTNPSSLRPCLSPAPLWRCSGAMAPPSRCTVGQQSAFGGMQCRQRSRFPRNLCSASRSRMPHLNPSLGPITRVEWCTLFLAELHSLGLQVIWHSSCAGGREFKRSCP